MRRLHRYILGQFLYYLVVSSCFFAGILLAGNVLKRMMSALIEGRLTVGHVIFLLATLLPSLATYALPFGMVAATLLTLGGLSANREYTALRSTGISPIRIFSPILLVASLGIFVVLAVNFYYGPHAVSQVKAHVQNMIKEDPLRFVSQKKFIEDFPGYILFVNEIDHGELKGFRIWSIGKDDRVETFITARKGFLEYDAETNALKLTLLHGTLEHRDEKQEVPLIAFEQLTVDLSMDNIFQQGTEKKKIRNMTYSEEIAFYQRLDPVEDQEKRMEIRVDLQMKGAMAFGILALVLATIPFAIQLSRRENTWNTAFALLLSIVYYLVVMFISFLEKKPYLRPDLLIWIPNFLLEGIGLWGILRLCRR